MAVTTDVAVASPAKPQPARRIEVVIAALLAAILLCVGFLAYEAYRADRAINHGLTSVQKWAKDMSGSPSSTGGSTSKKAGGGVCLDATGAPYDC